MGVRTLMVTGYGDSGPEHWQTRWEKAEADSRRVAQRDYEAPVMDEWTAAIAEAVGTDEVVLIAHSLGCPAVAHWAAAHPQQAGQVRGALLVAPADVDSITDLPLDTFVPIPTAPLPFTALVVASDDDPYCTPARAEHLAAAWGAGFTLLHAAGHINADSGLGDWPEGRALLAKLLAPGA